ncbi:MAG TPA: prolyl oligopeptidase family serine peptidase [Aliidongia sp.]|nr:prolyl oligopeptidase family serine peptidase [Aliidongia sp.]
MAFRCTVLLAASLITMSSSFAATPLRDDKDPFIWLEQVDSPRAMKWVRTENEKSLSVLERDSRFQGLYGEALAIAQAKDRIPTPHFIGGEVYNFWQDPDHVRGIWRKTSLADYRSDVPHWQTVLDLDELARTEKANWVWVGADCRLPDERFCLISLSDGGEDASTVREFDLQAGQFVKDGFELPKSKQSAAWEDADKILATRDWGPGTMTASGYPFVVKSLERGQPLSAAREIFRGKPEDVGIGIATLEDAAGHKASVIQRGVSFFEQETYLVDGDSAVRLNMPLKSSIDNLVAGRLVIELRQDWTANGSNFPAGSLVSVDLAAAKADPQNLRPVLIYAPGPRESLGETAAAATVSRLIVVSYDNVRGRAAIYTPTPDGGWSHKPLALPDNSSVAVVDTDFRSEKAFLSVTSFLTPSTLWLADAASDEASVVKALPPKFDASGLTVDQHEAISSDGAKIPYFLVHAKDAKPDGQTPTILYAYGGFQDSITPTYSANIGKLWLERGGAFVIANIRGGGEFGPAWHEAGLKTHRQIVYDDFVAVAKDLIDRKVTSPRRLGIQGGSNGGLLMGVEFTQHPELWNAVDIQVPLLDMLRFEKIAAGASWVGEYGSVSNPEERAFLTKISPYNNIRAGAKYPEPFIWTTTKDDRVGPQHARKFAAKLAEMKIPYLYYEVIEGGHASGANLKERAHTTALELTYFTRKLMD